LQFLSAIIPDPQNYLFFRCSFKLSKKWMWTIQFLSSCASICCFSLSFKLSCFGCVSRIPGRVACSFVALLAS
jgi:hypothetical protein